MLDWIIEFDSRVPWKTIWIVVLTHWNEPWWLVAQQEFIKNWYHECIKRWKVFFIRVNIEAYEQNTRFIDVNMNRIWKFLKDKNAYEYKRFYELLPILDQCDIVVDIHSTSKSINSLMWICHTKDALLAQKILKTNRLLIDDAFDDEWSLISFVTKRWWVGFGIECGYHEQDDAWKNALDNMISLLRFYDMIDSNYNYQTNTILKSTYKFYEEVYPRSESFAFTKIYENFDAINPWEVYATDWSSVYKNETNSPLYLWIIWINVRVWDGIGFLFTRLN